MNEFRKSGLKSDYMLDVKVTWWPLESEIKCSFFESRDCFWRLSIGQLVIMVKKYPKALVRNDLIIMLTCSMVLNDTFWWLLMILVTLSTPFISNFVRKGSPIISKHLKNGRTWKSPKNVQMIHNSWIIMNIIYRIEDFRILDITWLDMSDITPRLKLFQPRPFVLETPNSRLRFNSCAVFWAFLPMGVLSWILMAWFRKFELESTVRNSDCGKLEVGKSFRSSWK